MIDILLKIRDSYLKRVSRYRVEGIYIVEKGVCLGLCSISNDCLEHRDFITFKEYLEENKKGRKIFYDHRNRKTANSNQFLWNPTDVQVRLKWLDKQIAKLEKKSS